MFIAVFNTNFINLDSDLAYEKMPNGFDLNIAFGRYRSSTNAIMASLLHKPSNYQAGEATVDWYPADVGNKWGLQVFRRTTYAAPPDIWIRSYSAGDWQYWYRVMKDSDLITTGIGATQIKLEKWVEGYVFVVYNGSKAIAKSAVFTAM